LCGKVRAKIMKYFVTGATGFIGGHVARQLIAGGHEVVALVRSPEKAQNLAALGIKLHPGDVTNKASMRAGVEGVDGVYHIAGWYKVGVKDRSAAVGINVDGTRNVLELMKECGIAKGVYTSTLAVNSDTDGKLVDETYHYDGPHISEYDRTKAEAHQFAEEMIANGLPLVIVMPGGVYGPGDTSPIHDTWVHYLTRKLPLLPQKTALCWGHIEDTARGHLLAMEKGRAGESYIIAGPAHTVIEVMQMAEKIVKIPGPRLQAPPGVMKTVSAVMGYIETLVPVPENFSSEYLRVNAGVTYIGSSAKARRELGFEPSPLEEGLRETLAWEMAQLEIQPRNFA
jgi:nucleoside-diphosphate-sugar epimerase